MQADGRPQAALMRRKKAELADEVLALRIRLAALEAENPSASAPASPDALSDYLIDAIEHLRDAFVIYDADGRLVVCNDHFRALYGYTHEQTAPGVTYDALVQLDIENRSIGAVEHASGDYSRQRGEQRRRLDGSITFQMADGRWIEAIERPTRFGGIVSVQTDISEQRRAEEARNRSERLLIEAIESLKDGFAIFDEQSRLLMCNRSYRTMFLSDGDILEPGTPFEDLVEQDIARGNHEHLGLSARDYREMRLHTHHSPDEEHFVQIGANGRWIYSSEITTEHGTTVGIHTDITELKEAEEALRTSERRLMSILEASPIGVALTRPEDGKFLYANHRMAEMLDVAQEEVLGMSSAVLYLDSDRRAELLEQLRSDGAVRDYEVPWRRPGQQTLSWSEVSVAPFEFEGEQVLLGWNYDITDRKKAEEDLRLARDAAGEAQTLMRDAIESVSEGFALFDEDDRLVLSNSMYRELYRYSDDDAAPGRSLKDLIDLDVARGTIARDSDGEQMLLRRTKSYGKSDETFDLPLADGRWVQIRDRRTSAGGTVSIHADVTERKQVEGLLLKAKEEAENLARVKSDFVAVVSHEVRTPMNGVLGMARLLRDTELDEEQRECVETIVASGESLLTIIDDLLDISKLEADKLELESIPFVPADVVSQSVAVMTARAEEKGLRLDYDIAPGLPPVLIGDPHRLRQVLLNLISNAIKFTEAGSVHVGVDQDTPSGEGVSLRFTVRDTGQGIREEHQKRLFSSYTQGSVEVARKYGGTGLGLAICRRLVALMEGEIGLQSVFGEGSTFRFTARFAIDRQTDIALLRRPARASRPLDRSGHRPLRILQAEDNDTNRRVVEKILHRAGHVTVSVSDGAEALARLEHDRFDAIVLDRHMPRSDGLEATRRIRQSRSDFASIPIIGVTAGASEAELRACRDAGMDIVLTKPLDEGALLAALAQMTQTLDMPRLDRPVLVIDDIATNRRVAQRQLARLAIDCDLAASGAQALEMTAAGDYALILVDLSMPEMDGIAFARHFLEQQRGRPGRPPIVAMTGHAGAHERQHCLAAGMHDVLVKPVALDELRALLHDLSNGSGPGTPAEPEPATSGDPAPAIDMALLSDIIGSDERQELKEMLELFVAEFPDLLTTLQAAVESRDREAVRDRAHAAKSAGSSAAAMGLSRHLQTIENSAGTAPWPVLEDQFEGVRAEFQRVDRFLRDL